MLFVLPNAGFIWVSCLGKLAPRHYGRVYPVLEGRGDVGRCGEEMLGRGECKEMHTED